MVWCSVQWHQLESKNEEFMFNISSNHDVSGDITTGITDLVYSLSAGHSSTEASKQKEPISWYSCV